MPDSSTTRPSSDGSATTCSPQPGEVHSVAALRPIGPAALMQHGTMLVVACVVVMLSCSLTVREDQRIEFRWLPGHPLPHSCVAQRSFGVNCAGCGLTRSFVYLAEGGCRASYDAHRLGWLMALAVLLQFPYRLLALRRKHGRVLRTRIPHVFGYVLVFLLLANWLLGFLE